MKIGWNDDSDHVVFFKYMLAIIGVVVLMSIFGLITGGDDSSLTRDEYELQQYADERYENDVPASHDP